MTLKKSAHYQRQYRQRLRDMGLVKKEIWILPERAPELYYLERQLRQPGASAALEEREAENMKSTQLWTTQELFEALSTQELFNDGRATIELLNAAEPCLHIVMHDYGDLPLFMTVSRQHILVEALLWPAEAVKDRDAFNCEVLRTHKFFSLSTVGLDIQPDGTENYIMFGSLSAFSILPNVVFEIETLADNVIRATEAYEDFVQVS
ncbi:DUF2170 domain-containing protein [Deltaproteobacteria bacterium Smac51]|nr:DUF2170 domain-containing protein [Deltaproteobacteria bacterium Smac51]